MSNLFTEVSVEQQAIVTGGLFGQSNSGSLYQRLTLGMGSESISTAQGSTARNTQIVDQINTGAFTSNGYNSFAAPTPPFQSLPFN
jgi:hypothetical protein